MKRGSMLPIACTGRRTKRSSRRCGMDFVVVGADTGMMGGIGVARVHGFFPERRGHDSHLPERRLRRQSRSRHLPARRASDRSAACRWKRSRPQTPPPSQALAELLEHSACPDRQGGLLHGGFGTLHFRRHPRRSRCQRNETAQGRSGRERSSLRRSRKSAPTARNLATARRSACVTRWSSLMRACVTRRISSPEPTRLAITC